MDELDEHYWRLDHESQCPRDVKIKIPTYPRSERLMTISVCNECRCFFEPSPYWISQTENHDLNPS